MKSVLWMLHMQQDIKGFCFSQLHLHNVTVIAITATTTTNPYSLLFLLLFKLKMQIFSLAFFENVLKTFKFKPELHIILWKIFRFQLEFYFVSCKENSEIPLANYQCI